MCVCLALCVCVGSLFPLPWLPWIDPFFVPITLPFYSRAEVCRLLLLIVVACLGHHRRLRLRLRLRLVVSSGLRVLLRRRHLGSTPSRWFSVDHHLSQFVDR